MFKSRAVYYAAIVIDFVLRFLWTLTLVPYTHNVKFQDTPIYDVIDNFLGPIEILRRSMWAVFRVENEHLHSAEHCEWEKDG